jgi:hypothetical protein
MILWEISDRLPSGSACAVVWGFEVVRKDGQGGQRKRHPVVRLVIYPPDGETR